jgi:glycosyltransferase involved in cell wall biosynthesis
MRYAWTFYDEYFGKSRIKAMAAKPMLAALRHWDCSTADRVDHFVAISKHVQKRIKKFYDRDSDIVYPPVDTGRCTPSAAPGEGGFDLVVSAMVPYKRIDLAVSAYTKLGYPLKIVGVGGQLEELRCKAGGNIEFLEWQPDSKVLELYRSCRMLIFPGEEDFGIVPLEAQACGRPVVAFRRGGALETIKENISGIFFDEQTPDSLLEAVEKCAAHKWNPAEIRRHAENFSIANFTRGISECMHRCING